MKSSVYKTKILNLIDLLIPVSKTLRKEFYTKIAYENYIRLFFVSGFYLLFELYIINTVPNLPKDPYLRFVSTFILYFQMVAVIIALWNISHKNNINGVLSQWIISIYCILILYWAVTVSLNQMLRTGSITMFILTMTATSALFFRRTLITILTNLCFSIYFAYNMKGLISPPNTVGPVIRRGHEMTHLFRNDAFLITGLSCILGVIVFRLRLRVFRENKALEDLALKDSMTQLMNHKAICDTLKTEIQRSERYSLPLSILIIDIDHFKKINDTYGHQFGDEVIIEVANTISDTCRETDFVGRYGGDEFLVILTNTSNDLAGQLCERLRHRIQNIDFGFSAHVTISCGLKSYLNESEEEMISMADQALYHAKENGRNRFVRI